MKNIFAAVCGLVLSACCEVDSSGSGGSAPKACNVNADCIVGTSDDCIHRECVDGQCQEENWTPTKTCHSPDPDGANPAQSDPGTFHCWGGACCYGCIVDSGDGHLDSEDGPCVAGSSDQFCGTTGSLCQDCSAIGAACIQGECVKGGCESWTDCPNSTNECMVPTCTNGHCGSASLADGVLCQAIDGTTGTCSDGVCECASCDDSNECTYDYCNEQGACSHSEKTSGAKCGTGGHCFGGECCEQCYYSGTMECVSACQDGAACGPDGVCPM